MHAKDELRGTKRFVMTSKEIGKALGIGPAILLHTIDDFMQIFEKAEAGSAEPKHFRDGRWWVWNSYQAWEENIEVLDARTIERYMVWLEELGILLASQSYNETPYDRTKWYTIDYETLDYFLEAWHGYGMPRRAISGKQSDERQQFEDDWLSRTNGLITPPWVEDHATVASSEGATVGSPIPETPETPQRNIHANSGVGQKKPQPSSEDVVADKGETAPKDKFLPETELEKLIIEYAKYGTKYIGKSYHELLRRDFSLSGEEPITPHQLAHDDYRYLIWAKEKLEQMRKASGNKLPLRTAVGGLRNLKAFREWCEEHKREYRAPGEKIDAVDPFGGKSPVQIWKESQGQKGTNNG